MDDYLHVNGPGLLLVMNPEIYHPTLQFPPARQTNSTSFSLLFQFYGPLTVFVHSHHSHQCLFSDVAAEAEPKVINIWA